MLIGGFQKMTMLDFPGKVACTVYIERTVSGKEIFRTVTYYK